MWLGLAASVLYHNEFKPPTGRVSFTVRGHAVCMQIVGPNHQIQFRLLYVARCLNYMSSYADGPWSDGHKRPLWWPTSPFERESPFPVVITGESVKLHWKSTRSTSNFQH